MSGLVLVTGANGFVGRELCKTLSRHEVALRAAVRGVSHALEPSKIQDVVTISAIGPDTDWTEALHGVEAVVHLAARVHVMRERFGDPLAAYREVNALGTERLANAAAAAGVRRFVYVSTIKVNGEMTFDKPFHDTDAPSPQDPYGVSKWEAEQALRRISSQTGMEIVIVRPPLIYGPGVKGNFLSLLRLVDSGLPLPFGLCWNRRSFMGLENFVDLLRQCVSHPAAAGGTFLVSDGEDLSTPELLRQMGHALNRKVRLFPVPRMLLRGAACLTGQSGVYDRICRSLQVDSSQLRRVMNWTPRSTVSEELARVAEWYQRRAGV